MYIYNFYKIIYLFINLLAMSRSMSKQRATRYEIEVPHETLYPILVNASQRNKELFMKTLDNSNRTQERENQQQSNNQLLRESSLSRNSLSPFRWTTRNFILPQLQQKNKNYLSGTKAGKVIDPVGRDTEEKKTQELEVIKEKRPLLTSRAQIRDIKKSFKKYDPNLTYRAPQELPNVTPNTARIRESVDIKLTGYMFIIKSKDTFIRKALLSLGWIQNKNRKSPFFQLKWTNTDTPTQYTSLKDGQYYNHIKNTEEITNKGKLSRNIHKAAGFEFYPRTYNLQSQYFEFLEDFNNTGVTCLLKKYVKFVKSKVPFLFDNPKKVQLGQVLKLNIFTSRDYNFTLNIALVVSLCLYLEKMRKDMNIKYFQYEQGYIDVDINVDTKMVEMLLSYSRIPIVQKATQKIAGFEDKNLQTHIFMGRYEIPSEEILSLLILYYKLFKRKLNFFGSDGTQNIWIFKPSAASKGQGIELINRVDVNTAGRVANKIAQKYVENCFLMKQIPKQQFMWKYIEGKKFDIRQWVLLTSSPRRIYKFSSSYMRFCSEPYSLTKIKDEKKHLTNYYVNKGNFESSEEWSILSVDQLFTYLKTMKQQNIEENFHKQVDKIIVETISNNFNKFEFKNNCFELFGFDFLMDEHYKLWLMEVNASPACEQRSIWLKEMLQDMGMGLLKIVLPENYIKPSIENETPNKNLLPPQYSWKLIYGENSNENRYQTPQQKINPKGRKNNEQANTPRVHLDYAIEGSIMKEIHKKVQAQKFFSGLSNMYSEINRKEVIDFLKKIRPIKQHPIYNFTSLSMFTKILQMIVRRRKKPAMKLIKLEYYDQVTESDGKPDSRQIDEYYEKYYSKQ